MTDSATPQTRTPQQQNFFRSLFRRFPVATTYMSVFLIWKIVRLITGNSFFIIRSWDSIITYICITATFIALAGAIWGEFFLKKKMRIAVEAILNIVFIGVVTTFYITGTYLGYFIPVVAAMFIAAVTAVVFIPAVSHKTDTRSAWLFAFSQSINIIILTAGYYIIFYVLDFVGGKGFSTYNSALSSIALFLLVCDFMRKTPTPELMKKRTVFFKPSETWSAILKYVMLPVSYIIVLAVYVFALWLIFIADSPEPIECVALSCAVILCTGIVFVSTFYTNSLFGTAQYNRYVRVSMRLLPALTVPLTVVYLTAEHFMPVPLDGPLATYYYVIGIWSVVSALFLTFDRCRNFNLIPLGFSVAVLAAAAIPGVGSDTENNLEETFSISFDEDTDESSDEEIYVPEVEMDLFDDEDTSQTQVISDEDFNEDLEQMRNK